jgi:hypothetical protein
VTGTNDRVGVTNVIDAGELFESVNDLISGDTLVRSSAEPRLGI